MGGLSATRGLATPMRAKHVATTIANSIRRDESHARRPTPLTFSESGRRAERGLLVHKGNDFVSCRGRLRCHEIAHRTSDGRYP